MASSFYLLLTESEELTGDVCCRGPILKSILYLTLRVPAIPTPSLKLWLPHY